MNQLSNTSLKKKPELLLIATSARVLLESAMRGDYATAVIDGFGDREVIQHAVATECVGLRAEGGLDDAQLADSVTRLSERYSRTLKTIIVGSGVEGCNATYKAIEQSGLNWLGNHRIKYQATERLKCHSHSERLRMVAAERPPYLYKSAAGSGGVHIYRDHRRAGASDQYYRQTYLPYTSISHLFIADGNRIETVGFSTQWHSKHDARHPFCFGGAINTHCLDRSCIAEAETLANTFALKGLNNIDYLYDGAKLYFLELNPRPSATMALYDADYASGLLHAHINACRGNGLTKTPLSDQVRAFAILYAHRDIDLPANFCWPKVAKDVAVPDLQGYHYAQNAPICSLHVQANDSADTLSKLQRYINALQRRIATAMKMIATNYSPGLHHETPQYSY